VRGFNREILYIIARLGNPKGLAIKSELQQHFDEEINHGRVYPNLDTLAEKGLINVGEKDNRTKEYSLSEKGMRAIQNHYEYVGGCLEEATDS
jgi:DNA-binding PadR family transcriptional regulator